MQEVISNILGKPLTSSLLNMLKEFKKLGYDEEEIYRNIKDLNDISIMCLYLLATEYNTDMSYYIKKSHDRIMDNRVKRLKDSYRNNSIKKYISKLDKTEVINLAHYMGLYDLSNREYNKLNVEYKYYYKLFSEYIKNVL